MSKETLRVGRCILAEKPRRHRKDAAFSREMARLREIEKIIRERHGQFVPDPEGTDDRDTCLAYVRAAAFSRAGQDLTDWCHRWAPWVRDSEILSIEMAARRRKYMMKADGVAGLLRVTMAERDQLSLKTIGACDLARIDRMKLVRQRKLERDREAKRDLRKSQGRRDRVSYEAHSLSSTKPWVADGVSRRTWERRRRVAGVARVDINSSDDTLATHVSFEGEPRAYPPSPKQDGREAAGHGVRGSHPRRWGREAEPHGTGDSISGEAA
ncbi:hypothetical protein [Aureimonas altamirensis]|uniref:hypothetical protein n=1 Tax=Aureimonas altamirensis TaxID=370622 RepID=UPI0012E0A281|nr:hypothetical protein [Aureimonas altamirensis]